METTMTTPAHDVRRTVLDRGARRILFFFMATITAVVLLFGYRTSSSGASVATGVVAAAGTTTGTTGSGSSGSTATTTSGAGTTYTGSVASTRWGDVQVAVTVTAGKITNVQAVEVPSSNQRDVEINNRAVPVLDAEALKAQSASIDTVSGATVTSDGYLTSLQSALDAAGL
jgi:uncharacterized protein with FMN-binding domain